MAKNSYQQVKKEEIKNWINWINDVYEKLRTLLSLYEETDCFNTVPEGEAEEDIQEFINKKIAEIRKSAQTTSLYPDEQEIAERLVQIVDETEYFVRQYEVPGVVLRWKQINPRLIYFDCAFDLMEKCPEAYMKMRRGLTDIHLSCYPDSELITQRNEYFAKAKEYYERNNLEYSEERIFQDELLNTLTLLFKDEFKKDSRICSANSEMAKIIEGEDLNKMDCNFYFLIKGKDKTVVLKEEVQKAICQRFERVVDVRNYSMRSGPDLRSSLMLKDEWSDTIPEKIKIVLVDRETEVATLLSWPQRDMFFDMVMESTEDLDTVPIAEYVINEIDAVEEYL